MSYNVNVILKKYNAVIKKKFGQNFLTSPILLSQIANVSAINGKEILEIGAGPGGLTSAILQEKPSKLISIEIDKDYYEILQKEFGEYKNFEVINADAVKINEKEYFDKKINVIANLPYNVGTHLLLKWLNKIDDFESFTLLLQKEVVERIIAKPCTKEYGYLSVITQALTDAKKMFDVKPTNFIPPPNVMSSVVHLIPKKNDINVKRLTKITTTLFAKRRKKIKNAMESLNLKCDFIDVNKRAEEISVEEYIKLSCF
ncbi:MAG: 16S rRNA (adenine(1518)-N(6)/adenine(1519)-N(6))-dimethyltransferase RsmA [Rickettsiales bacterium]|jgi:16S rRNA (adenine1518-N6/adenine1519-N6)-dimethyltransferase|nr:16S rRNA (adenine(1518)-N(6)/adenine(1519)-N(6))-dimethyltransferase RsmA [Rickettsiales bacterium]